MMCMRCLSGSAPQYLLYSYIEIQRKIIAAVTNKSPWTITHSNHLEFIHGRRATYYLHMQHYSSIVPLCILFKYHSTSISPHLRFEVYLPKYIRRTLSMLSRHRGRVVNQPALSCRHPSMQTDVAALWDDCHHGRLILAGDTGVIYAIVREWNTSSHLIRHGLHHTKERLLFLRNFSYISL